VAQAVARVGAQRRAVGGARRLVAPLVVSLMANICAFVVWTTFRLFDVIPVVSVSVCVCFGFDRRSGAAYVRELNCGCVTFAVIFLKNRCIGVIVDCSRYEALLAEHKNQTSKNADEIERVTISLTSFQSFPQSA
jgi:hypothetical protein